MILGLRSQLRLKTQLYLQDVNDHTLNQNGGSENLSRSLLWAVPIDFAPSRAFVNGAVYIVVHMHQGVSYSSSGSTIDILWPTHVTRARSTTLLLFGEGLGMRLHYMRGGS